MNNELTIFLLCVSIFIANILWFYVSEEKFVESMQRAFYIIFGAVMAFFVLL